MIIQHDKKELEALKKIHEYCIETGYNPVLSTYNRFRSLDRGHQLLGYGYSDPFYTIQDGEKTTPARLQDRNVMLTSFLPYIQHLATIKRKGTLLRDILE